MNRIISDTAEYGCYLFKGACKPLLENLMKTVDTNVIGKPFSNLNGVDSVILIAVKKTIR